MTKKVERDSLPYIPSSPSISLILGRGQAQGISTPENTFRGALVALEDDDTKVFKLFLQCRARRDPLRLNVRTSSKCEWAIDVYPKELAEEGIVAQSGEDSVR